jgi:hypothetical protein
MTNEELADEIIRRLNDLLKDSTVRSNLTQLIEQRVVCSPALNDHPTVQVNVDKDGTCTVGLLGMLNGLVGVIGHGPRKEWGLIAAVLDDKGWITKFTRTDPGG